MDAKTDRPDALDPIDLAGEPDFVLGASKISPSTREVLRGNEHELLEPRVMQVLVALFQANSRVVSRDELIARCWDGRIVGEDAINRAISRLRRLSEVDREASFQIETISRVGYRLLPSGTPSAAIEYPAPPASDAPLRQSLMMRHRLVIATTAAIAVAAATTWLLWPERKWTAENARPFLSSLVMDTDPAFSPDGAMLAYSGGPEFHRQIYIRNLAAGDSIRITNADIDVLSPTWSSDGGHLAYVGIGAKPDEPCHMMVATVPAGVAREVGRCRHANLSFITWQPGTNFLYYAERGELTGDSITRLDLDSGAQVPVVLPRPYQTIDSPHCSPDGKWLAYLREDGIVIRDLASGRERRLAPLERRPGIRTQLAWTPDSRALLASLSTWTGSRISAFPIDGGPSYSVYTTANLVGTLAASKNALAMVAVTRQVNFARPVATPDAPPDVVDAANGFNLSPSFAPDGTLAFTSNRSGSYAVWIQKPGGAATQLFDVGSAPLYPVQFSPDGSRLVVGSESRTSTTIRILTPNGAILKSFTVPPPGAPFWTADGKAILVFDRHDQRTWRINADDPDKRSPFGPRYWAYVTVRPEGTFAASVGKPGIWRIDGKPNLLTGKYPSFYYPRPTFRGSDVLVPDFSGPVPRLLAQPLLGGADRLLGYLPGALARNFQPDLVVNPKTGDILYTSTVISDTNIDLLTLMKR